MRIIRNRAAAAAATALVATLALTACSGGGVTKDADSATAPAASVTPPEQQAPAQQSSNKQTQEQSQSQKPDTSNTGTDKDGKGGKGGTGGKGGSTQWIPCTGDTTKVTVTKVSRPINHLLLTATNTGNRNCDAYSAPLLRFDEAQAATQVIDASRPQAVVTLAPGESAYASIMLSGEGDGAHGYTATNLTVFFDSRDGQGSVGSGTHIKLPAGTYTDDDAAVSYWQYEMNDALTW